MSDVVKLYKRTKGKPTLAQIEKAEKGEQGEGVRDTIKAGKGGVVSGAKKRRLKKEGLPSALKMAKKFQNKLKNKK